ncbi:hypothetical protein AAG570_004011 [Ranatra chinensis]|uniref:Calcineurin-like phosphoesterase domain-containing protein n=1 Tax=Ranatra chinensis TaxID=642074 RepID=A0ABD0Y2M6_9HEMI
MYLQNHYYYKSTPRKHPSIVSASPSNAEDSTCWSACFRDQLFRLCLVLLLILVFYNEFLVYRIHYYLTWPKVQCGDTKDFHRVLFVADPQILGERTESWIARWDSDRFLAHSFQLAVMHVEPTLIVFLGDLMDEGSIASPEEYARYYKRFSQIYKLDSFSPNTTIFIPGDNDIGGEDEEITSFKVKRYYNHFHQAESLDYDNIRFIKVNKLLKTYPIMTESDNKLLVRVVLSHVPLFAAASYFSGQVVTAVRPHFVFSAHDHKSVHFVGKSDTGERTLVEELMSNRFAEGSPTWRFQISDSLINEIVVPTCSYRMGVVDIGFGVGLLGNYLVQ